jgi:DDE_Tnp_1-associated
MQLDLVKFLKRIPDVRRRQGTRYPQDVVILMILMAILSQHTGFRGYARFMKANKKELVELFDLKHGVPSHVTIRSIIENIPQKALTEEFITWMGAHVDITDNEFVSSDGKVLRSTVSHPNDSMQSFVSIVSLFGQKTGLSYGMIGFDNGKSFEGDYVKRLIELFKSKGIIIDLDALHCKKNS